MSFPLVYNGQTYIIPTKNNVGWGQNLDDFFIAIAAGSLQKTGGNFTLSAETNFGASFGLKALYLKSVTSNPSSIGVLRLANTDSISWRNTTNTGDLPLGVDISGNLTFNGSTIGTTSLTNSHIYVGNVSNIPTDVAMSGDVAINNTGVTTIQTGAVTASKIANDTITNTQINSTANIARTKLASGTANRIVVNDGTGVMIDAAAITASRALQSDANGIPTHSAVTSTELGYVAGTTSNIQAQINALTPSGSVNPGTAGNLGLYNTTSSTISDAYVQNANNIFLSIATHAGLAATRTYTVPNAGASASFVMTQGTNNIPGILYLQSGGRLRMDSSGTIIAPTITGADLISGINITSSLIQFSSAAQSMMEIDTPNITFPVLNMTMIFPFQGIGGNSGSLQFASTADNGANRTWRWKNSTSLPGYLTLERSTTPNATPSVTALAITGTSSLLVGAAVTTTATDGFLYIPTCPGTPTGVPTSQTGLAPLVVDDTNNKLYFYSGGAWIAVN